MEELFEKFYRRIDSVSLEFIRGLMGEIDWDARLIGIRGARGVGKTTLLLQYIKKNLPIDHATLYVNLDNIWFSENKLVDMAADFVKKGGKFLFLDEVHKYPGWSQEIKNIFDDYPDLKIVFTGSSLLEILNARADLSRRAIMYTMFGLSFREYLGLALKETFPVLSLEEVLNDHLKNVRELNVQFRPLAYFGTYLKSGYYPFFREQPQLFYQRLEEVVNMILEVELPGLRRVNVAYVKKLKRLLQIIAESVPFMPNVTKLSERIQINRNTLTSYLFFMQEAHLTKNLYRDVKGMTRLQKPDKIYLENTNLQFALSPHNTNVGNIRETFFINQLSTRHVVEYTDNGDFLIDGNCIFEVGGKAKTGKQIKNIKDSYIAADDIEYGTANEIPLWLFGFLY